MKERLIDEAGLKERGIEYSKSQRNRLIKASRFPRPVKIGPGRALWIEREIDAYIANLIKQRDAQLQATAA